MMTPVQENKMGVMPIPRLLFSVSVPMMISMLIQALYNVVDSIYVARLPGGTAALAALSIAFPVQNLMIAVGSGTGVGINALLSRSLGEKNFEEANRAAKNGIFLAFLSFVAFLLFGLFGVRIYMHIQSTNDPLTLRYGSDYLTLCCSLSLGLFGQFVFERLLQSTGKTFYAMITQSLGAIINILLDPLFIFGMFGLPKMEVAGAAIATVIGQFVAMVVAVLFNVRINREISVSLKSFRPNAHTIREIYSVGVPSIIMGSISSVVTFCLNIILDGLHKVGVAVFGIYFKLESFIFMPVFGLNNGMVPVIAYNYGARHKKRINQTILLSLLFVSGMMLTGLTLFRVFPEFWLSLFDADASVLEVGVPALRTICLCFPFAGIAIVMDSVFQALSHGALSMLTSIGRQLVVLVPVAYLLSLTGDINAVWWAFPIAEIASLLLSLLFFRYVYRKDISPLEA